MDKDDKGTGKAGRHSKPEDANVSRRKFLAGMAATSGALVLGGCSGGSGSSLITDGSTTGPGTGASPLTANLPPPEESGIEHIIVVMMENRSFDHMLGWLSGADGIQEGLQFPDDNGVMQSTFPLAPEFQGCGFEDPGHGYDDYFDQFAGGALDGWLVGADDLFPIGYYTQQDLGFFSGAAPAWTTFDRYFCATPGQTFPNRFYQHAGQTDRLSNDLDFSTLPTIWDRLADAGLSGRYYFNDLPFLGLWADRYLTISQTYAQFLLDTAIGNLPNVAFVDPRFGDGTGFADIDPPEELGIPEGNIDPGNDDHPFADIRDGQAFMNQIYEAVVSSPNWENTVLIFNYDEWGGFYDHVLPPEAPIAEATQQAIDADPERAQFFVQRLGFRTPTLMISPLARRGHISSVVYDHTSVLRMIEWRFGLEPLSVRDASANNMAQDLDFNAPKNLDAPRFATPPGPFGIPCAAFAQPAIREEFAQLLPIARRFGFPLPAHLR